VCVAGVCVCALHHLGFIHTLRRCLLLATGSSLGGLRELAAGALLGRCCSGGSSGARVAAHPPEQVVWFDNSLPDKLDLVFLVDGVGCGNHGLHKQCLSLPVRKAWQQ
jgi:hypothetical protein